jgi:hypothetical protein
MRLSATKNVDKVEATALTTHRTSAGTDHANVGLADTHRTGNGADHANVALADTHRGSNGTDHANVGLGDTHRTGSGSDHANVATATADISGGKGPCHVTYEQAVLSDATIGTWIADKAGAFTAFQAFCNTACTGAGSLENTQVDLTVNGATVLTVKAVINAAAGTNVVEATIDPTKLTFAKGNVIRMVNDYTADGGGANTGAGLVATLGMKLT